MTGAVQAVASQTVASRGLGRLEPDEQGGSPRLVFANQLRGLAALSVVLSHLLAVYWWVRGFVAVATVTPVQTGATPGFAYLTANPWFQPGPFGVALFFLISGLVIPFSLDRHHGGRFLLARALRIFPTYLAALAVELAVLHFNGWFWGRPFPYDGRTVLLNGLLVQNLFGAPGIDLVNWSLCIELAFYLLLAVLAPLVRRRAPWLPLAYGVGLMLAALALRRLPGADTAPLQAIRTELPYLIFMALGMLFTLRLPSRLGGVERGRGGIGPGGLFGSMGVLIGLFAWSWRIGPQAAQYPIVLYDYGYALVLFGLAFLLRGLARPIGMLDRLAAISYPFYLVHFLVGASVMKLAMLRFGWTPGISLIAALGVVIAVAQLLHRIVERPTIAAGRALAKRPGATPEQ